MILQPLEAYCNDCELYRCRPSGFCFKGSIIIRTESKIGGVEPSERYEPDFLPCGESVKTFTVLYSKLIKHQETI